MTPANHVAALLHQLTTHELAIAHNKLVQSCGEALKQSDQCESKVWFRLPGERQIEMECRTGHINLKRGSFDLMCIAACLETTALASLEIPNSSASSAAQASWLAPAVPVSLTALARRRLGVLLIRTTRHSGGYAIGRAHSRTATEQFIHGEVVR